MEKEPVNKMKRKNAKKQWIGTTLKVPFIFLDLLGLQFTTFLQRLRSGLE